MAFNGNWGEIVLKVLASLLSQMLAHICMMIVTVCVYVCVYYAPCSWTFFLVFSNIQNHKAITTEAPLKIKCLPVFFSFASQKKPLFITHLCQVWCFLISCFEFEKTGPLGPSCICLFLRTLLTLKTLDGCLAQAQASGWQWPDPCHVNPHWMAWNSKLAVHGIVRWAPFPSQLWPDLKP